MTDDRIADADPAEARVDLDSLPRRARAMLELLAVLGPSDVPRSMLIEEPSVHLYMDAPPSSPRSILGRVAQFRFIRSDGNEADRALRRLAKKGPVSQASAETVGATAPARRAALKAMPERARERAVLALAPALDDQWTASLDDDFEAPEAPEVDGPMLARAENLIGLGRETLLADWSDVLETYGYRPAHSSDRTFDEALGFWRGLESDLERLHGPGSGVHAREELQRPLSSGGGHHAEEAIELYTADIATYRRVHGPEHENVFLVRAGHGAAVAAAGRHDEAAAELASALAEAEAAHGSVSRSAGPVHIALAKAHSAADLGDDAVAQLEGTLAAFARPDAEKSADVLRMRADMARELEELGSADSAAEACRNLRTDVRASQRRLSTTRGALLDRVEAILSRVDDTTAA
ncbi:hypothetical protein [Streptomonospora salina]|uniref:Tetratricopeptide repeat protein n=1 Tax=Streptomonospora salina TaxID=104205 RepID=A0A841EDK5_9ACTN|nr:hypothetical protein [Streptomonospora salina]MBB5997521.1 hypothetical protein [Streptomonospora salina]